MLHTLIARYGLDKVTHAVCSYALCVTLSVLFYATSRLIALPVIISATITLLVGILKETFDEQFSLQDLLADLIGTVIGGAVSLLMLSLIH